MALAALLAPLAACSSAGTTNAGGGINQNPGNASGSDSNMGNGTGAMNSDSNAPLQGDKSGHDRDNLAPWDRTVSVYYWSVSVTKIDYDTDPSRAPKGLLAGNQAVEAHLSVTPQRGFRAAVDPAIYLFCDPTSAADDASAHPENLDQDNPLDDPGNPQQSASNLVEGKPVLVTYYFQAPKTKKPSDCVLMVSDGDHEFYFAGQASNG